jgi:hypothetical protein
LGEPDAEGLESLELGVDVVDRELREWDAILDKGLLEAPIVTTRSSKGTDPPTQRYRPPRANARR